MLTFVLTISTPEYLHGNSDKVMPDMSELGDSTPINNNLGLNTTHENFTVGE